MGQPYLCSCRGKFEWNKWHLVLELRKRWKLFVKISHKIIILGGGNGLQRSISNYLERIILQKGEVFYLGVKPFHSCLHTHDKLQCRFLWITISPSCCILCKKDGETHNHLFLWWNGQKLLRSFWEFIQDSLGGSLPFLLMLETSLLSCLRDTHWRKKRRPFTLFYGLFVGAKLSYLHRYETRSSIFFFF